MAEVNNELTIYQNGANRSVYAPTSVKSFFPDNPRLGFKVPPAHTYDSGLRYAPLIEDGKSIIANETYGQVYSYNANEYPKFGVYYKDKKWHMANKFQSAQMELVSLSTTSSGITGWTIKIISPLPYDIYVGTGIASGGIRPLTADNGGTAWKLISAGSTGTFSNAVIASGFSFQFMIALQQPSVKAGTSGTAWTATNCSIIYECNSTAYRRLIWFPDICFGWHFGMPTGSSVSTGRVWYCSTPNRETVQIAYYVNDNIVPTYTATLASGTIMSGTGPAYVPTNTTIKVSAAKQNGSSVIPIATSQSKSVGSFQSGNLVYVYYGGVDVWVSNMV